MNNATFAARKQRYEQAVGAFNGWFLSDPRNRGDYRESVVGDLHLLATVEECQRDLLAAPALSLAEVAYKLELSIGEVDDVGGEDDSLALLLRALVALRAGSLATAIRALNRALRGDPRYDFNAFAYHGAAAALADLQRLSR